MHTNRPLVSAIALAGVLVSTSGAQDQAYKLGAEATTSSDYGRAVGSAGDIDADGVPDILVGSPFYNPGSGTGGGVFIYSGKTGALLWSRDSEYVGDAFGWAVDGIGDITGDGKSEIIVGAPLFDNNGAGASGGGKVYVLSPGTDSTVMTLWSNSLNTQIGLSVRGLGDITGDGVPDFAMGAPLFDNGGLIDCGAAFVYSGATQSNIWVRFGSEFGERMGFSIEPLRTNVANASTARVAFGAPRYDGPGTDRGRIVINSGDGFSVTSITGSTNNAWFGNSIAGVGDVNGDGTYDFAVSAPYANILGVGDQAGLVRMYSGLNHQILWTRLGSHAFAKFGFALAGIGDVGGDGNDDLLVGSPFHEIGGVTGQGEARVISSTAGQTLFSHYGGINDEMGYDVGSAGDLNGDGHLDYIIGAKEAPFGAGEAYVHLTRTSEPVIYCTAKVNSQGCTPEIGFEGIPSLSIADNFYVNASQVVNQKPGLMLWGRGSAATPFQGGILCVAAPITRTTVQSSAGSLGAPDCSGTYSFHFSQAYMASQSIGAGETIFAQYWSRDNASSFGVGLTDAVAFVTAP